MSHRKISQDARYCKKIANTGVCTGSASVVLLISHMRNTAKKILIVDSNDAFRESLGVFIKGLGHEVFEAATAPEAIDRASSIHPDLIMMDVRLPGLNGDEVTAQRHFNQIVAL